MVTRDRFASISDDTVNRESGIKLLGVNCSMITTSIQCTMKIAPGMTLLCATSLGTGNLLQQDYSGNIAIVGAADFQHVTDNNK